MKYLLALMIMTAMLFDGTATPVYAEDVDEMSRNITAPTDEADIDRMLADLSAEELETIIAEASKARLKMERRQALAEIKGNLLYAPGDIQKAEKILSKEVSSSGAEARRANLDCICRAFALVDGRFQAMLNAYDSGQYNASIKAPVPFDGESTYLAAATRYVKYRALAKSGRYWQAAEKCRDIIIDAPEKISFAAEASLSAAELYRKHGRGLYALEMYMFCLRNYSIALKKKEFEAMVKKVNALSNIYHDPLGSVAQRMGRAADKISHGKTGKETLDAQKEAVAILEDLIKYVEEKPSGGSSPKSSSGKNKNKNSKGREGTAKVKSPPSGTDTPSSPAEWSTLVPGPVRRPSGLSEIRPMTESGDWASLPPRKRQEISAAMKKIISEHYRRMIRDYHSSLAEYKPE